MPSPSSCAQPTFPRIFFRRTSSMRINTGAISKVNLRVDRGIQQSTIGYPPTCRSKKRIASVSAEETHTCWCWPLMSPTRLPGRRHPAPMRADWSSMGDLRGGTSQFGLPTQSVHSSETLTAPRREASHSAQATEMLAGKIIQCLDSEVKSACSVISSRKILYSILRFVDKHFNKQTKPTFIGHIDNMNCPPTK